MAISAPRPCTYAGCCALVNGGSRCANHKHVERKAYDEKRESPSKRGYGTQWQKARVGYLRLHPLCKSCDNEGVLTQAAVVDHVIPHKGDKALFWDHANWQPLCKRHHDSKTAKEDGGFGRLPIDRREKAA